MRTKHCFESSMNLAYYL